VIPDPNSVTSANVRRAFAGDGPSLGWLVEHLSPLLVAQARWRLGPALRRHYDPDDLVGDAWLAALPNLATLPARDGRCTPVLLRFLSTAIFNRVNNLVKKHLRRTADPEAQGSGCQPSPIPPDAVTGVVTAAIRAERRALVLDAIEGLDAKDREILLMRGVEQRANSTVAEFLGLTPSAAAMRYQRALERLRAQLGSSIFDELD